MDLEERAWALEEALEVAERRGDDWQPIILQALQDAYDAGRGELQVENEHLWALVKPASEAYPLLETSRPNDEETERLGEALDRFIMWQASQMSRQEFLAFWESPQEEEAGGSV